ncbi:hypothetical protein M2138_001693 [Dysgonomonadaceae bacterium PH5-43]|nr:hypothetical protein [Dysgonomonadaceae bacterium PH5-43]
MKKWFVVLSLCVGVVFTSCIGSDEGENVDNFSNCIAVVGYDNTVNLPTLNFYDGYRKLCSEIIAPQLSAYAVGTGIGASFKIDYNKLYQDKYVSVTEFNSIAELPNHNYSENKSFDPLVATQNTYPLSEVKYSFYTHHLGRIFMFTEVDEVMSNDKVKYNMVYVPEENVTDTVKLYLYAEVGDANYPKRDRGTSVDVFNLEDLFDLGEDTTIASTGAKYKKLNVNLKYCSSQDAETGNYNWTDLIGEDGKPEELLLKRY